MEQHVVQRSAVGGTDRSTDRPGAAWCGLLAALSLAAGVIHLVMVPQHAVESLRTGLAFAAAGWFQAVVGVALVAWPRTRRWLPVAIAANVLFIAVWAVSRTVGLPGWTGDGGVESVSTVDLICVAFEAAFVLCGVVALVVRPAPAGARPPMIAAGLAALAVIAGTTVVLASPETAAHAHAHDAHDDADADANTAAGHVHADTAATATDTAAAATGGGHVHADSSITYAELPAATKSEVDQVIAAWGTRYPTAADAVADGWFRATRSLYGIGAHYVRGAFGAASTFDMLHPNILLFDGEGPDARFAGVSYVVGGAEPEGFTGDFDVWHSHDSVCLLGGTVVSLTEEDSAIWLSEADCTARGGRLMPLGADLMMHLWIGPGYIDHGPIFAHDHPWLYGGFNPQRDA